MTCLPHPLPHLPFPQVEELRKKMAVKQEELAAAKQEAEKRGAQVAVLEGEVDKQAAVIKDMQVGGSCR
jgi:hypothetical protein